MRKKPQIRYRAQDKQRLRELQRKVNNRIYYERSKGGDISHLPNTIKISDLESSIATRADFNFQLSQMNKLLKKDAMQTVETESGRKFTKGVERQVNNAKRRENIKRRYKRIRQNEIDMQAGKVLGSELSAANKPREFDLKTANPKYVDATIERILNMSMDSYDNEVIDRYKENYIKGLKKNYASQDIRGNYTIDNDLKELINMIEDIDPYKFYGMVQKDERYSIRYRYTVDITEDSPIDYLKQLWKG